MEPTTKPECCAVSLLLQFFGHLLPMLPRTLPQLLRFIMPTLFSHCASILKRVSRLHFGYSASHFYYQYKRH